MNTLSLSWKNILSNPLNTLMSVLLFALSIALITFLFLFNYQFRHGLDKNLAGIDLVIGAKGSPLQLILNSMYHIDAPTGNITLQEAAPFLNPAHPLVAHAVPLSLGDSYGAYRIVGTTPSILKLYGAEKITGEIYKDDFETLIGDVVAHKLKLNLGDEFYSTHGLMDNPDMAHDHGSHFVVKGILQSTGTVLDQLILCTPQTIWKVHSHDSLSTSEDEHTLSEIRKTNTNSAVINLDSTEIKVLTDSINSSLKGNPEMEITSLLLQFRNRTSIQSLNLLRNINQNTGMMAASPAYEINRLYAILGTGAEAIQYLAILIAIVAAISIFISLYTSLKSRRYEMAIMRVSGAGPGKITNMIIGEGLWIAILGIILGLASGHIGMELAGNILQKSYHYQFTGWIWHPEELYIILGAIFIGLLASIIPAIEGSRTELHSTLAEN
ncbi:MAG TPA: ABC transporter permease [Saprospiraceae bacterium]|nr:ABC transporter permease [Saprospiraceae bacterium]